MIVYLNGRFVPKEQALISPDDRGFLFADGVYEVVHSYRGRVFRAEDHWQRLRNSLRALRIQGVESVDFQAITASLIEKNNLGTANATVYLQVTRGAAPRKHPFPGKEVRPTVYAFAAPFEPPQQKWEDGVRVILAPDTRWARCDIKSVALLPNILACQAALEAGADEAVFVRDGAVTEGSRTNFAVVRDGQLWTYPESNYILGGITRKAALELCRQLGIPAREFPVMVEELKSVDEALLLGTTTEVTPVVQIDDLRVGDGQPGPVTRRLQEAFARLVGREKAAAVAAR